MAKIYRCDRCGNDTEYKTNQCNVRIPLVDYSHIIDESGKNVDLCFSCIKQLNEWVKPLARESKE